MKEIALVTIKNVFVLWTAAGVFMFSVPSRAQWSTQPPLRLLKLFYSSLLSALH